MVTQKALICLMEGPWGQFDLPEKHFIQWNNYNIYYCSELTVATPVTVVAAVGWFNFFSNAGMKIYQNKQKIYAIKNLKQLHKLNLAMNFFSNLILPLIWKIATQLNTSKSGTLLICVSNFSTLSKLLFVITWSKSGINSK